MTKICLMSQGGSPLYSIFVDADTTPATAGANDMFTVDSHEFKFVANIFVLNLILFRRGENTQERDDWVAAFNAAIEFYKNYYTLYVKTLAGKTITIYVPATASIADVKDAVQEKEGIPQEQQKLTFAGMIVSEGIFFTEHLTRADTRQRSHIG